MRTIITLPHATTATFCINVYTKRGGDTKAPQQQCTCRCVLTLRGVSLSYKRSTEGDEEGDEDSAKKVLLRKGKICARFTGTQQFISC